MAGKEVGQRRRPRLGLPYDRKVDHQVESLTQINWEVSDLDAEREVIPLRVFAYAGVQCLSLR
jgi:hypothetical protein